VLLAVCQEFDLDHEFVSRGGASLFAGGIGNTGSVCGAVIGGVMAIGLKNGRADTMEEVLGSLQLAGEFRKRFETEAGTISCRELTSEDLSTPQGIERYMNSDKPMAVCAPAVALAHRLAVDLLRETG
jgi:C_GCAxxG_C_C family probable redox protein